LQGLVDMRTALPDIFIFGVDGRTQTTTFDGASGDPLDQATFFGRVSINRIVKMSGQFDGMRINPVNEAQLEN
jgi:hypothetical protein